MVLVTAMMAGAAAFAFSQEKPAGNNALPTGTVKFLGSATCLSGAPAGATCRSIQVSCSGIPDLNATLGTTLPSGTPKGTILLVSGHGGTTFFDSGFANTYLTDGYRVVQLAWASDWEDTGGVGLKSAACRPATVFKSVFTTVHKGSRTAGFCGQGTSGGGAALAYSLVHYGIADYFDYVVIAAGPGVSRMDYGCDKPLYTGPKLNLCPLLTDAPFTYTDGSKFNNWEGTTTCATRNPPQADIDKWAGDSLVSSGATYSYPKTSMSWFFCVTKPNNSTGQGKFLIDQVLPRTPADVNCYSGICTGEAVWQDAGAFDTTHSEMLSKCVPNHQ